MRVYPIHPNELAIVGVACRLASKIDLTISSPYACGVNIFPQKAVEVHQLLHSASSRLLACPSSRYSASASPVQDSISMQVCKLWLVSNDPQRRRWFWVRVCPENTDASSGLKRGKVMYHHWWHIACVVPQNRPEVIHYIN